MDNKASSVCPGASEPKNMIYMSRLGIWGEGTPFKTFDDFLHAIEKRCALLHSSSGSSQLAPPPPTLPTVSLGPDMTFCVCFSFSFISMIDRGVGSLVVVALVRQVRG